MMKQFVKFMLIGVSNTTVNFLVYNLVLMILERLGRFAGIDYLIAQFCGFMVSVFWSFCMNRRFVFNSKAERAVPWQQALVKMYLAYGFTGVGLNSILSIIWVHIFSIPKEVLSLLNDLIGLPANFLLNKFWAFRKSQ